MTPPDGEERRSGCDRREWNGEERRQHLSVEAPGGFKANLSGGGQTLWIVLALLTGLAVGAGGVGYFWLRALIAMTSK